MSLYPLMLDGSTLTAVIVGGGAVATRKAAALVASGARVRVVAPVIAPELQSLGRDSTIELVNELYSKRQLDGAGLVIAATNDEGLNRQISVDAKALGLLVNVASAPSEGNCVTPAVHRSGDVVVAVTAGGVPSAAARIRDDLAQKLDERYASAVRELSSLRRSLIDGDRRARWSSAATALIDNSFCERVESGRFDEAVAEWR